MLIKLCRQTLNHYLETYTHTWQKTLSVFPSYQIRYKQYTTVWCSFNHGAGYFISRDKVLEGVWKCVNGEIFTFPDSMLGPEYQLLLRTLDLLRPLYMVRQHPTHTAHTHTHTSPGNDQSLGITLCSRSPLHSLLCTLHCSLSLLLSPCVAVSS